MHRIITLILGALFLSMVPGQTKAQRIFQYKSDDFDLVYFGKRYTSLVPHVAGTFRNAADFQSRLWDYKGGKTFVMLNDFQDFGHGGAITMPVNQVFLGIEPYSFAFSIIPSNERFQWLFNHELTHVAMADKGNKQDMTLRWLLAGKVRRNEKFPLSAFWSYLTVPRWYSPRWYHEGMACFLETWMSGGMGRAMGNYDEMYFRSIVAEKLPLYSLVGLETEGTAIDFQVGANSYLYGTRFVSYLANQYGIGKLKSFYNRTEDSKPFFASQFKKVYGLPVNREWKNWITWENEFQNKNIATIKEYPLTPFLPLTRESLGSVSKYEYNRSTGKIYAAINHPGKISRVVEIDKNSGKIKKICTLDSPVLYYSTHLAYDPFRNKIFISEQNNNFRSLVEIDVKTGSKKRKIPFSRVGDFAFNPADKSLWGVRHDNGYSILVKIPEPYTKVIPILTIELGKAIFDLDVSHSGKYLSASLSGVKGEQSLILFDLGEMEKGKKNFRTMYKLDDNTLTQFKFSDDDRYLIGTSYYTGVSNIWRVEVETGEASLMSNTETGFFMPLQINSDSLMVLKFTRDGMIPGTIPIGVIEDANSITYLGNLIHQKNPEVEQWSLPPAVNPSSDSTVLREGKYSIIKNMRLASAFPDVTGFKNIMAVGYRFNWRDNIGISDLNLFIGGSPWSNYQGKQKIHAQLDWKYINWNFFASYNKTDFYDLFGPTRRSRAGYTLGLSFNRSYTLRSPFRINYDFGLATYGDLEVLPQYQNIKTPIRNFQVASASYEIEKLRKTLGGVDDERGYSFEVESSGILAGNKLYPSFVSNNALGVLVPGIRNTSFWIRNSTGISMGDRSSALSHFYFGGFRNNYVDWQAPEQYRKPMAFPGVEIDEISAYHYVKTMADFNLKPIRLNNVGFSWFYPTYIKSSLFATHLLTDFDKSELKRNVFNAGAQVDIQLVLFTYLKTTWSAGYAVKTEKGLENKQQFMLSLKLLGN